MDKTHYIYRITNLLNDKVYIGQTNNPNKRWYDHKYYARKKQLQYIHRAMAKYGVDNFAFEIISVCIVQGKEVGTVENEIINQYDSRNAEHGYNIAPGDTSWNAGLPKELQPNFGNKMSDEHKAIISVTQKKRVRTALTLEHKTKIKVACAGINKGKKYSKEHCDKLSQSLIGRKAWNKIELSAEQLSMINDKTRSADEIATLFNVNRTTVFRWRKKELQ